MAISIFHTFLTVIAAEHPDDIGLVVIAFGDPGAEFPETGGAVALHDFHPALGGGAVVADVGGKDEGEEALALAAGEGGIEIAPVVFVGGGEVGGFGGMVERAGPGLAIEAAQERGVAGVVEGDVAAAGVVADEGEFDGIDTAAGAIGEVEVLVGGGEEGEEPGGAAEDGERPVGGVDEVAGVVAGPEGERHRLEERGGEEEREGHAGP